MKTCIVATALLLLAGLTPVASTEPKGGAAPGQKILGAWKGQTGCAGSFLFRANGTYELTGYGPAPYDSAGTWKVRGDALPATLVLTCKSSEVPEEAGKTTEVKLIRLDDETLAVQRGDQPAERYARVKR
jgi:hypothetical protein